MIRFKSFRNKILFAFYTFLSSYSVSIAYLILLHDRYREKRRRIDLLLTAHGFPVIYEQIIVCDEQTNICSRVKNRELPLDAIELGIANKFPTISAKQYLKLVEDFQRLRKEAEGISAAINRCHQIRNMLKTEHLIL